MTEQVMNGTIRLLHQGGDTADLMSDWHPVFNQLIMHMIDNRLRGIVEMEGFLSPGQGGGRQGRSVTINTSKPHAEAVECRHSQKIDECRWALVLNRMRCGKCAPLTYFVF